MISVLGEDRPGLVAGVTRVLAKASANIIDIDQSVLRGLFAMFMVVDYSDTTITASKINSALLKQAKELNTTIEIKPYREYIPNELPQEAKNHMIVTLLGKDKPGVIYMFSNLFCSLGVNIERIRMIARGELIVMEFLIDAKDIRLKDQLQETAEQVDMDIVFQSRDMFNGAKRMVVFDMDKTLVDVEIIDEIARVAGTETEVKKITESAMQGDLEFKDALRRRVKLLKGLPVSILEDIADNIQLTSGAEDLILTLKDLGYKTALISGGFSFFTEKLREKFDIDYAFGNELVVKNGKLTGEVKDPIIDAKEKREILIKIAKMENLAMNEIIAIGDGANDRYMIDDVGLGIAFNPKDVLKKFADGVITQKNIAGILYCLGDYREKVLKDEKYRL